MCLQRRKEVAVWDQENFQESWQNRSEDRTHHFFIIFSWFSSFYRIFIMLCLRTPDISVIFLGQFGYPTPTPGRAHGCTLGRACTGRAYADGQGDQDIAWLEWWNGWSYGWWIEILWLSTSKTGELIWVWTNKTEVMWVLTVLTKKNGDIRWYNGKMKGGWILQ